MRTSTALIFELIVRERLPVRKVIVASSQATLGEGLYLDAEGNEVAPDIRCDEQLARGEWEVRAPAGFRPPMRWKPSPETLPTLVAQFQNAAGRELYSLTLDAEDLTTR